MKKINILRNKNLLDREIELFSQGIKDILAKISEKKSHPKKAK